MQNEGQGATHPPQSQGGLTAASSCRRAGCPGAVGLAGGRVGRRAAGSGKQALLPTVTGTQLRHAHGAPCTHLGSRSTAGPGPQRADGQDGPVLITVRSCCRVPGPVCQPRVSQFCGDTGWGGGG